MALTGPRSRPPLMCPVPIAACADGALAALQHVAQAEDGVLPSGAALLGERAALAGLARNGRIAPGGGCRLLDCADGRIALSLARPDDWNALPAWLDAEIAPNWDAVSREVERRSVDALVDRGRLLGLAIAADPPGETHPAVDRDWCRVEFERADRRPPRRDAPLVIDLSSLWAGPLCAHLLGLLGARVIKVESATRPDGARAGPPAFYDLLNHGKESVALDIGSEHGRQQLQQILAAADIVIEASRPRALRQLGVDARQLCAARESLTWISLTGYGRHEPQGGWIAYGDDAGVSAGLSRVMYSATGEVAFCADAIADPLGGMHAALAAWWSHRRGGSRLIAVSLHDVVRACVEFGVTADALLDRQREWIAVLAAAGEGARPPRARTSRGPARSLGADTAAVLGELGSVAVPVVHDVDQ